MTNYSRARDEYLESEVLSAGPVRRVQLLYEGAIDAIVKARLSLAAKDIPARAAQVNKALDILGELALSLDHSSGASMSKELVELYDYAQRRLIDGTSTQTDKPFAEAEQVLKTLQDAWKSIPEIETPSIPAPPSHRVPRDYGSGDTFSVGSVGAGIDQLA